MSFHFAAARSVAHSPIARALARKALGRAANDNPCGEADPTEALGGQDLLLKAALRHFGEHGLGAAREARKHAERAFFTGDSQSYRWWLGVCRALDRRLAAELDRATAGTTLIG
ncbi:hypothetical protein A9995_02045 [Erythrobacter sp. QSSC1-22B]|uniref:hypothetical protein n=1 Tax=Erythrobacter sp. QSSC1-22B TaxID=1860125 RepID=UPI0008049C90|nr:hypothetical protein [Erythrobacter sp. QSSC1-22B]OBX20514.1 hypothetical protein A9995_02045 [Erythrobacter sp. QSSC1-22B]